MHWRTRLLSRIMSRLRSLRRSVDSLAATSAGEGVGIELSCALRHDRPLRHEPCLRKNWQLRKRETQNATASHKTFETKTPLLERAFSIERARVLSVARARHRSRRSVCHERELPFLCGRGECSHAGTLETSCEYLQLSPRAHRPTCSLRASSTLSILLGQTNAHSWFSFYYSQGCYMLRQGCVGRSCFGAAPSACQDFPVSESAETKKRERERPFAEREKGIWRVEKLSVPAVAPRLRSRSPPRRARSPAFEWVRLVSDEDNR